MRDIRDDLKERIAANNKKRADIKAHYEVLLKTVDDETAALSRLLSYEEHRFREFRGGRNLPPPVVTLGAFFIETLRKEGPKTKEELRQLAVRARYFEDNDNGGRATHATLLNIERAKRIRRLDDGQYEAIPLPVWDPDADDIPEGFTKAGQVNAPPAKAGEASK